MTGHDVDLVSLHLTVEPDVGLTLDQTLAELAGHGLDGALVEVEFPGDPPVRQKLWGERRGLRHHRCADNDGVSHGQAL
jgi:hypothetical protein